MTTPEKPTPPPATMPGAADAVPPGPAGVPAMPDLVSGRFAFLAGSAAITAVAAGAFLLWARLTAAFPATATAKPKATAPAPRAKPARPKPTPASVRKNSGAPASAGRRVKGGTK